MLTVQQPPAVDNARRRCPCVGRFNTRYMCDRRKCWLSKFCADLTRLEASDRSARVRTTSIPRYNPRRNRGTRRKNEWFRELRELRTFGVVRRALLSKSRKELLDEDRFQTRPASIFDMAASYAAGASRATAMNGMVTSVAPRTAWRSTRPFRCGWFSGDETTDHRCAKTVERKAR